MAVSNRLIYKLPEGNWTSRESDQYIFFFSANLGPLPYWSFKHWGREFGFSDLREVYKAKLDREGMAKVLNLYGPWDIRFDGGVKSASGIKRDTEVAFADWYFRACGIQRAFYLWRSLRKGEEFEWAHFANGTLPSIRLTSWPKRLRVPETSEDYQEWVLDVDGPLSSLDADFHDPPTARRLAKVLLAQLIDRGLEGAKMSFLYDLRSDGFRLDVGEDEVLSLETACWLMLRDLTAGLTGLRFCANCGKDISRTTKSHAMTCHESACKQAYYRARKAAASHG